MLRQLSQRRERTSRKGVLSLQLQQLSVCPSICCRNPGTELEPQLYFLAKAHAPLTSAQGLAASAGSTTEVAPDPFGREAKHFTEIRVLNRDVRIVLEGVDKFSNLIGSVYYPDCESAKDVALELIENGLAKYVEWSASLMEDEAKQQLKSAGLQAKKTRLRFWTNYVPPATNSKAIHDQNFTGKVGMMDGPSAVAGLAYSRVMDLGSVFLASPVKAEGDDASTPAPPTGGSQPTGVNITELLIARGFGTKGIHSSNDSPAMHIADMTMKRLPAVVEYVLSAHQFKLFVPKETCSIAFSFSGVRCPGCDEPFSAEAIALMGRKIMQRDVEIEVETVDGTGTFLESMCESKTNMAIWENFVEGEEISTGPATDRWGVLLDSGKWSWVIDFKGIATEVKSAGLFPAYQIKGCGVNRECSKCHYCTNNSDVVSHEWPGFPADVKFDPSDIELLEHLAAKCRVGNSKPHISWQRGKIRAVMKLFHTVLAEFALVMCPAEPFVLFGVGVIGNPMGFARTVSHDIKDFLSVPARSVFQSLAGLITGMAQGTTSLLSNTVFAISDAATQFSRAAHKGIVAFTFDDQVVAGVEKQQKGEPSHNKGVVNEFLEFTCLRFFSFEDVGFSNYRHDYVTEMGCVAIDIFCLAVCIDRNHGRRNDCKTLLGKLNWNFTAMTKTVTWNVLPHGFAVPCSDDARSLFNTSVNLSYGIEPDCDKIHEDKMAEIEFIRWPLSIVVQNLKPFICPHTQPPSTLYCLS
ncbi:TUDOR-SN protein 1 [Actinidia rufa]|uniref:TUDOR-SN protein 1 n=1 Tax=Actinidia rufa TaxID=165716 RepID=A0A7J0DP52_9ERIC|nr:TUDOR-SN protein 1 [Actinidia rufa]